MPQYLVVLGKRNDFLLDYCIYHQNEHHHEKRIKEYEDYETHICGFVQVIVTESAV
jgi:hypothetical protein